MYSVKKWNDILTIVSGKNQRSVEDPNGKYPIYGSGGVIGRADEYLCGANTVIVGRKGTIDNPLFVTEPFWNIDTAFGIVAGEGLLPKFLYYFCRMFNFRALDKSTGRPSIAKSDLLKIEMPVPSVSEQERVVSRIEELFSELDSAENTLQQTKQQLTVYRHAVLKEAFDKVSASGHAELMDIVDEIRIGPFGTMLHKSDYVIDGVPVINPQHIKNGNIYPNDKISVSPHKAEELSAYRLKENDVIMGRRGEMGRTAPVTAGEDGWICGTGSVIIRLKKEYDAGFYSQILSSPDTVHFLEEKSTGTTMNNLNEDIVKHIPVPKVTKHIQTALLNDMDSKNSVCNNIEQNVGTALQQLNAMRQSALKEAFEGKL